MNFAEVVSAALGIDFQTVHVYYLVSNSSWMMMATSVGSEQPLPNATSLLSAQADAEEWISVNISRRVISTWNSSGGDESGSKAVYA